MICQIYFNIALTLSPRIDDFGTDEPLTVARPTPDGGPEDDGGALPFTVWSRVNRCPRSWQWELTVRSRDLNAPTRLFSANLLLPTSSSSCRIVQDSSAINSTSLSLSSWRSAVEDLLQRHHVASLWNRYESHDYCIFQVKSLVSLMVGHFEHIRSWCLQSSAAM